MADPYSFDELEAAPGVGAFDWAALERQPGAPGSGHRSAKQAAALAHLQRRTGQAPVRVAATSSCESSGGQEGQAKQEGEGREEEGVELGKSASSSKRPAAVLAGDGQQRQQQRKTKSAFAKPAAKKVSPLSLPGAPCGVAGQRGRAISRNPLLPPPPRVLPPLARPGLRCTRHQAPCAHPASSIQRQQRCAALCAGIRQPASGCLGRPCADGESQAAGWAGRGGARARD